jgi:hypothetical protein
MYIARRYYARFLYFLFPPLHNSCHGFSIRIMYGTEGILIWCSLARKQKLGDHLTRTVHLNIFPLESFLHTYIRMSQLASPTMWRTSTPNNHIIATVLGTRTPGPGSHVLRKWMTQRKAANRVSAAPSSTLLQHHSERHMDPPPLRVYEMDATVHPIHLCSRTTIAAFNNAATVLSM